MGVTNDLADRLRGVPGLAAVLGALGGLPPTYLVGGAVRDLLRGEDSVDLDLAIEGDAVAAAAALAERLGGRAVQHERFGTATVEAPAAKFDLAATRRERYERPGALPEVEPAPLADDLGRRDFSINAMAIALSGGDLGRLADPHGGSADLYARLVRVLHERSFSDDPTRLLRAVRYEARLGFRMDAATDQLAREAASAGLLGQVSGARVRDELLDLLGEQEVAAAVARLGELGLDAALDPALEADPDLVAGAALASAETGADRVLAALAALVAKAPDRLDPWVERLGLTAAQRTAVTRAASRGERLVERLRGPLRDSELYALLREEPPEALALTLALGAPGEPVLRYVAELRDARLEITGDDLVAAGISPSPAIGRALEETLRRKLDGELHGRDAELELALRVAREQAGDEEGS